MYDITQNMHFLRQVGFQKSKYFGTVPEGENGKNGITAICEAYKTAYNVKALQALKGNVVTGKGCRQ